MELIKSCTVYSKKTPTILKYSITQCTNYNVYKYVLYSSIFIACMYTVKTDVYISHTFVREIIATESTHFLVLYSRTFCVTYTQKFM